MKMIKMEHPLTNDLQKLAKAHSHHLGLPGLERSAKIKSRFSISYLKSMGVGDKIFWKTK